MAYNKTNWENLPSTNTPINATNLNKVENKVEILSTKIVTQASTNLNDYTEDGAYYFSSSVTPINIPEGTNGWLRVMINSTGTAVKQVWYRLGTSNSNDFHTYVRTLSGTWSAWRRLLLEDDIYYQSGDVETLPLLAIAGYLTTGATAISFTVPLPKRVDKVTTVSLTGGNFTIRHVGGGYLVNGVDFANLSLSRSQCVKSKNTVRVDLAFNTAFTATNNTPVALQLQNLAFSFS